MKNIPFKAVQEYFRDRTMLGLTLLLLVLGISYCVYVGVSLEPTDLQVATRYTAFGETNIGTHQGYGNKWHYMLSFIVFGVLIMGVHTALAIKLHDRGQPRLAAYFLGFSVLLLVIGWIIANSVLKIAFL